MEGEQGPIDEWLLNSFLWPSNGSALSCERADRDATPRCCAARRQEPRASEASLSGEAMRLRWRSAAAAPCWAAASHGQANSLSDGDEPIERCRHRSEDRH